MRLIVAEDYETMSRVAARLMAMKLNKVPTASIVVATGNTPLGAYRELARLREQGVVRTDAIRPFQLDEYVGVPAVVSLGSKTEEDRVPDQRGCVLSRSHRSRRHQPDSSGPVRSCRNTAPAPQPIFCRTRA